MAKAVELPTAKRCYGRATETERELFIGGYCRGDITDLCPVTWAYSGYYTKEKKMAGIGCHMGVYKQYYLNRCSISN